MRIASRVRAEIDSPIGASYALLGQRAGRRPLLDLGQAAPPYPPAPAVVEHIAAVARSPLGHAYVGGAGLESLRTAFADDLTAAYGAPVGAGDVVVTAGCNQAFCLVAAALAEPGDEIVTVLPAYFNHEMWLRMSGIRPVHLDPGPAMVPSAAAAEPLLTPRTRAIVLVTPGNPTGVTIPPAVIGEFATLARRRGIALVIDETYRSFRGTDEPPHGLFADPEWRDTLVSLHSFSKDLALPGYRVGAVVASAELNREVLKLLDCVAIGSPRVGQEAAWAGLTMAPDWRAGRAAEIAARCANVTAALAERPGGFEVAASGGFFAWVRHPFPDRPTDDVVRALVTRHDLLVIPGTAFTPDDRRMLRVSIAGLDPVRLADVLDRLAEAGAC
ncbi:MAG: aminotransferase [Pseudonocardia sp.]|nr:aminotransferase [Pseudonocardia sp.]